MCERVELTFPADCGCVCRRLGHGVWTGHRGELSFDYKWHSSGFLGRCVMLSSDLAVSLSLHARNPFRVVGPRLGPRTTLMFTSPRPRSTHRAPGERPAPPPALPWPVSYHTEKPLPTETLMWPRCSACFRPHGLPVTSGLGSVVFVLCPIICVCGGGLGHFPLSTPSLTRPLGFSFEDAGSSPGTASLPSTLKVTQCSAS